MKMSFLHVHLCIQSFWFRELESEIDAENRRNSYAQVELYPRPRALQ